MLHKEEIICPSCNSNDLVKNGHSEKNTQRWTWYAMERNTGVIIAWHNGKRKDEDLAQLLTLLAEIPIAKYYTDDWGAYSRLLPDSKHIIGKDQTWKIERKNLNFRTH